jgi:hypothetical protein
VVRVPVDGAGWFRYHLGSLVVGGWLGRRGCWCEKSGLGVDIRVDTASRKHKKAIEAGKRSAWKTEGYSPRGNVTVFRRNPFYKDLGRSRRSSLRKTRY